METFKENTYYPVGTQLIYKDKIIEVCDTENKKEEMILCGKRCAMESQVKCLSHICKWYERNDKKSIFYAIVGDAPKHDKPVVEGLQHLKNRQSEVYLETVAINEQVNIAVEPITRQKTILDRINEELHIWVDTYIMGGRNIRVILLSSKAYEEYLTLVPKKYWDEVDLLGDKRKQYLSVKVRRCPDVIDVELH